MPRKRKNEESETASTPVTTDGDPSKVSGDIAASTPIVTEPPPPVKTRKKRRTKKVIEAEEQQSKVAQDQLAATMIVDMKLTALAKMGGEVWKAEKEERQVQIDCYTQMLGQFPVLPWWVSLILVEAAFIGPRIVIIQNARAEAARKAKEQQPEEGSTSSPPPPPQPQADPVFGDPPVVEKQPDPKFG